MKENAMKRSFSQYGEFLFSALPRLGSFLAHLGMCAMSILVAVVALTRYFLNWTPMWGDEIIAYLIIFTLFMGAGTVLKEDRHIRITALFDKLSPKVQNVLQVIYGLIGLFFIGYVTYSLFELALMSLRIGSKSMNGVPIFPLQILLVVGLFLLLLPLTGFLIKRLAGFFQSRQG
jgi:C4-dicarboxylate transporter DctQ subunit